MEALPRQNLFLTQRNPEFQTDPVLLDGAGQVVAFWTKENLGHEIDIFPYSLKALHLFAPPPEPGTRVECRVRTQLLGDKQMTSDIDILGPGGRPYCRLEGWEDRLFRLPANFLQLRISPRETQISQPWETPISGFAPNAELACCRLEGFSQEFLEAHNSIWLKVLAHLVLSRREREAWRNLNAVSKRRREWLLGRCAAKDAVRLLLKNRFGVTLCPADVEILPNEFGTPQVEGRWKQQLGIAPVVSISHSHEVAVALAGMNPHQLVGIDIECASQRKEGFETVAFSPRENQVLSTLDQNQRREWNLRLWCAKEAVVKALGRGFSNGPRTVEVTEAEWKTGLVKLHLPERLAAEFPGFRSQQILAHTGRESDYIFSAVCAGTE